MSFLDSLKFAWRDAVEESKRKSTNERIVQAFHNGMAVGVILGASVVSIVWCIGFFAQS